MDITGKVAELRESGFCVLESRLPACLISTCREAFWPLLTAHLKANADKPNRGPGRYFLPVPFHSGCFAPEFFFDCSVLSIIRAMMGDRIVVDQYGCDAPVRGSENQEPHADYARPLFAEMPDLPLPPYMMTISFGLIRITSAEGPIQIAPGTQRLPRAEGIRAIRSGEINLLPVPLEIGDVLIRHPWALHRGTPNMTDTPRALLTIRYVRRWYADSSREVEGIPQKIWQTLTAEQQALMRFPIRD